MTEHSMSAREGADTVRNAAVNLINAAVSIIEKINDANARLPQADRSMAQIGAGYALLYVGDQIREQVAVQREQVEQQKLTNVLTALAMDADRTPLSWDTQSAAQDYIQARIGDIVNPRPESENQQ